MRDNTKMESNKVSANFLTPTILYAMKVTFIKVYLMEKEKHSHKIM